MDLCIRSLPLDTEMLVGLEGPVCCLEAPALRQYLEELVAAGHRVIVLDFKRVTTIDSSGLGAIISGLRAARLAGGELRVARVPPRIARLFNLTGLDRVIVMHSSLAEAMVVPE